MSSVIVYGQAPSRTSDPRRPLSGTSGRRLARLAGLGFYEEFAATFDLRNLLDRWPGSNGKGDRFPIAEARVRADVEKPTWLIDDSVVLLGREVARAFGVLTTPYLVAMEAYDATVYVIPHPSGVDRALNDHDLRARTEILLRGLARRAREEIRVSH